MGRGHSAPVTSRILELPFCHRTLPKGRLLQPLTVPGGSQEQRGDLPKAKVTGIHDTEPQVEFGAPMVRSGRSLKLSWRNGIWYQAARAAIPARGHLFVLTTWAVSPSLQSPQDALSASPVNESCSEGRGQGWLGARKGRAALWVPCRVACSPLAY